MEKMHKLIAPHSMAPRLAACAALLTGLAYVASAAEILIVDDKSQPESLTVAPGGTLIVGSASTPFVYKVSKGSTTPEKFVDASGEGAGTFFFGMLADTGTKTLWTCQLTPVPDTKPVQRHTALRGFDLSTGAEKVRWNLPGDNSVCNDFSVGPDKALYISDTANAKIYKLPVGAKNAELFLEDAATLSGIDGITFLHGTLYVNNVRTNKIYRVPVDKAGKAGQPVEIQLDQPIKGPDGMRAANGKLLVAENGSGKISVVTLKGDTGTITVIKDGLKTPTAVEPAGDTVWIAERGAGKAVSIPMPK
jgi:sugar lactone lactonase YvrE